MTKKTHKFIFISALFVVIIFIIQQIQIINIKKQLFLLHIDLEKTNLQLNEIESSESTFSGNDIENDHNDHLEKTQTSTTKKTPSGWKEYIHSSVYSINHPKNWSVTTIDNGLSTDVKIHPTALEDTTEPFIISIQELPFEEYIKVDPSNNWEKTIPEPKIVKETGTFLNGVPTPAKQFIVEYSDSLDKNFLVIPIKSAAFIIEFDPTSTIHMKMLSTFEI